ncbi:MAG: hypothetical protein ACKVP4_05380 [Hyphomicrobium sp.]
MITKNAVAGFAASLVIGFAAPSFAEDKHQHGAGQGHTEDADHYEKPTFANVKDAWAFMTTKIGEAEKLLDEKKIEPVHEIGEQIEGAVHTLEEKSDMVAADAKTKLASALKQLDKAVDDMHHAAEANDAGGAGLGLKKIKGLMPLVKSLYPAGALE